MTKALLIDYQYCTGCHTCEVACQNERHYPPEKMGVTIKQIGPYSLDSDEKSFQYDFVPVVTAFCVGCPERVSKGRKPSCVQHCPTACMEFGEVEDLAPRAVGPKKILLTIGF